MTQRFYVKGAGACCPDPQSLHEFGLDILDVDRNLLPASLRRRASLTTQMAITAASRACEQARSPASELPSVFASVGGEIHVTDELCRALPDSTQSLSPTRFHNSVHNTTAGYWGILHECRAGATAIAALGDTFAIGLLEACSQLMQNQGEVLLVCYDEFWPQYLAAPIGSCAFASAFVLAIENDDCALGRISLPFMGAAKPTFDAKLKDLLQATPVAASIPLLQALKQVQQRARVPLGPGPSVWYTELNYFGD